MLRRVAAPDGAVRQLSGRFAAADNANGTAAGVGAAWCEVHP